MSVANLRPHFNLNLSDAPFDEEAAAPCWDTGPFQGSDLVWLGFRRLGESSKEHWLNRTAVYWTRKRGDVSPGGELVHVEIALQPREHEHLRYSINKLTIVVDRDGKEKFEKGRVHEHMLDRESTRKYRWVAVRVPRDRQKVMYDFLQAQLDTDFNFWGYCLNNFVPGFLNIGARRVTDRTHLRKRRWFCSEVVLACLQLSNIPDFQKTRACSANPNSLYRLCLDVTGAFGMGHPLS